VRSTRVRDPPNVKSRSSRRRTTVQVLPVQPPEAGASSANYILSPDAQTILGGLVAVVMYETRVIAHWSR